MDNLNLEKLKSEINEKKKPKYIQAVLVVFQQRTERKDLLGIMFPRMRLIQTRLKIAAVASLT